MLSMTEKDAFIRKELKLVEVYLDNMRNTPAFRMFTLLNLGRDSRSSLRKANALAGYPGQWWRDIWPYFLLLLLFLIPFDFASTFFTFLADLLGSAMSHVQWREKSVEVPRWIIFTTTEKVAYPVFVAPHWIVSKGGALLILCVAMLCASPLLKMFWLREIEARRSRILLHWERLTAENGSL